MKYSSKNKPLQCIMTNSTCYKGTSRMTVKGVLWHSTGANNPAIRRYVQPSDNDPNKNNLIKLIGKNSNGNDWNHVTVQAGVHAWVGLLGDDKTVSTVQTLPWTYRSWGCGGGSRGSCNDGWIQFEICESNLQDKTYFNKVYKEACELTAYLCASYNLDPKGTVMHNGVKVPVILCHADSHSLGLGSGHADVLHWFKYHGKTMADVRNDVAALMKKNTAEKEKIYKVRKTWKDKDSQIGAYASLENAKQACKPGYSVFNKDGKEVYSVKKASFEPFTGYVTANKLNIRQKNDKSSKVLAVVKKGTALKVKEKLKDWYKIKYNDQTAYVMKEFVSKTKPISSYQVIVTELIGVNIRKEANKTSKKVGTLAYKQKATISKVSGNWGYIENKGWICLDYTKKV